LKKFKNQQLICSGGCGSNETTSHLFFECDFFCKLWRGVVKWLGIATTFSTDARFHALQFGNSFLFKEETRKCLMAIWAACCWLIWKERNNRFFSQKVISSELMLDKIKILVWWWLKSKKKGFMYDLNSWWLNPLLCMGINAT
jgi:hypothetical protein